MAAANPLKGEAPLTGGAKPLRGEADLEVGGGSFTLAIDINALCLAEGALELTIDQILARYGLSTNLEIVRALLWAALQKHHPCTIEQAGDIISDVGLGAAKAALEAAILRAMPPPEVEESEKKKPEPKRRPSRGTGSTYSKHGAKRATRPPNSGRKPRAS